MGPFILTRHKSSTNWTMIVCFPLMPMLIPWCFSIDSTSHGGFRCDPHVERKPLQLLFPSSSILLEIQFQQLSFPGKTHDPSQDRAAS